MPQNWPFCWWVAVVVDHFSRRIINIGVFANKPSSMRIPGANRALHRYAEVHCL